jgi:3-oxoadipate enol-lactonase
MHARINGFEMSYEVSGRTEAPAVVLHHPLATTLKSWDELTAALEPNYRVIRFDARGHGKSEATPGPYTFEQLSSDAIGLMDHVGVASARYVGLSMGGFVGQYLGLLHPGRFHSLALVSTSSNMSAGQEIWTTRIKTATEGGMPTVVDGAMARWVAPDVLAGSNPALVDRLRAMILATPPVGYVGWCEAIRTLDITGRLGAIKLPVQVIVGALDPATPPAGAEVIHKAIPGSEFVVMPGVSHMLQVEQPAAFHAHLLPFLAKHGPKG